MEIDKKVCVICKKQIVDEKEYVCTECYEKSLKELKNNELYQDMKKNDIPIWMAGAMLAFALLGDKGDNND